MLDACAAVQFQEQPATIEYEWRGALEVHFPDYLVVYASQLEFWECKRDSEADDLYVRRRTERLQELLASLGIVYRLVSTSQLLRAAYYRNAIELRRHARALLTHPEWAKGVADTDVASPAGDVLGHLPPASQSCALSTLLYHHVLEGDLALPLGPAMPVRPPSDNGAMNPWVLELFRTGN